MTIIGYAQITPDLQKILKTRSLKNPPTLGPTSTSEKAYWVVIDSTVTDTSTGPDTITESLDQKIRTTEVLRPILIRDKTSSELDAEADEAANHVFILDETLKGFALVVLDEINLLRSKHLLTPRTQEQLRDAVKNKIRGF
jgi:hypothetical protein